MCGHQCWLILRKVSLTSSKYKRIPNVEARHSLYSEKFSIAWIPTITDLFATYSAFISTGTFSCASITAKTRELKRITNLLWAFQCTTAAFEVSITKPSRESSTVGFFFFLFFFYFICIYNDFWFVYISNHRKGVCVLIHRHACNAAKKYWIVLLLLSVTIFSLGEITEIKKIGIKFELHTKVP